MRSGWFFLGLTMGGATFAAVDFQRDIRPILSNNCFQCHGPDKDSRMAGLRLDRHDEAFAARANGAAIVPGDPARSLLYQRITASRPALRMPPASAHKELTAAQVNTLKDWIAAGAPWKEPWAFVAPVRPPVPNVRRTNWVRNPIDAFILSKLEAAGLTPAGEAERRRLARRVSLDVTGLPPRPEMVESFVNDRSPGAYEKMVDRLLESPAWGEHRARYWLDAARYGDTHGIHIDNYREMWPYRDWVIQAFNRNLPFDQFTVEQLAGDLLPSPSLDQLIATGFQRCNVTTNEAGIISEEYEAIYAKDRVDTTGAVWLGLTIGCATCHDHKFDPLTQRDHYSLAAFFRNTTQPVMDGNVSDTPPVIVVPRPEDRARWASLRGELAAVREQLQSLPQQGDSGSEPDAGEVFARREETEFAAKQAIDVEATGLFDVARPFSIAFRMRMPKTEESLVAFSQYIAGDEKKKTKSRGVLLEIGARVPNFRVTGDKGDTVDIRAGHLDQLAPGTWTHVVLTYDGSGERQGFSLYLNGKPVEIQGSEPLTRVKGNFAVAAPLRLGGFGSRYFEGGALQDFRVYNRMLSEDEARLDSAGIRRSDDAYRSLNGRLLALESERRAIRRRAAITHVMRERETQPFAHVLFRGMYDQPRERVEPATPAALPMMPASYPRNRLGLARWLVNAENPLTARVTVNRFWQEVFGTGLVKTAEDFGSQGEPPTHPELLDWLAVEFRESGWDIKKLFRLMLTSATYRQSAVATDEKLKADPENRLLSRGPRFRMDGEMVRDYALATSGLLNAAVGGPSVKPYQPEGVWETVAMLASNTRFYKHDSGGKLYRRSLYTFWKRSAPPASMEIFNAPTRESCTVRRERTNTPLQALVTLNDEQFVEAARALAEKGTEVSDTISYFANRLLFRPLTAPERQILEREYRDLMVHYDSHPAEAARLLGVGAHAAPWGASAPRLAAATMLANQMMNLDEVLVK